jgi:hypothetical protein
VYLDGLNTIARGADTGLAPGVGGKLALVVFDIKPPAATADHGVELLDAIRTHLIKAGTADAVDLTIILSVGTKSDKAVFDRLSQGPAPATPDSNLRYLGPREGVQVDADDDPDAMVTFFTDRGFTNIGYGNGTLGPGPHLIKSMDRASYLRTAYGVLKAVTYAYTINLDSSMRDFISTGADGIISDDIADLKAVVNTRSDVRLATRADNPLRPDTNESSRAYGIKITTTYRSLGRRRSHLHALPDQGERLRPSTTCLYRLLGDASLGRMGGMAPTDGDQRAGSGGPPDPTSPVVTMATGSPTPSRSAVSGTWATPTAQGASLGTSTTRAPVMWRSPVSIERRRRSARRRPRPPTGPMAGTRPVT